jgi:hypothetical protein
MIKDWHVTRIISKTVRGSKNYLGALYRCTASLGGKKRAGFVVAHAMLRIPYYLLTREEMYVDLGADFLISKDSNPLSGIHFEDLKA